MSDEAIAALDESINVLTGDVRRMISTALKLDTSSLEESVGALADELSAVRGLVDEVVVSVRQEQPRRYTDGEIPSSTASRLFFTENPSRLGATIYNNSTAILYVKLGNAASSTSFTVALAALTGGIGGYYEVPYGYTGPVAGAWASANGVALVVELTT